MTVGRGSAVVIRGGRVKVVTSCQPPGGLDAPLWGRHGRRGRHTVTS